jgi:hypothetical protein
MQHPCRPLFRPRLYAIVLHERLLVTADLVHQVATADRLGFDTCSLLQCCALRFPQKPWLCLRVTDIEDLVPSTLPSLTCLDQPSTVHTIHSTQAQQNFRLPTYRRHSYCYIVDALLHCLKLHTHPTPVTCRQI